MAHEAGITPLSWFLAIDRNFNEVRLLHSGGKVPSSALPYKYMVVIVVTALKDLGRAPARLQSCKEMPVALVPEQPIPPVQPSMPQWTQCTLSSLKYSSRATGRPFGGNPEIVMA